MPEPLLPQGGFLLRLQRDGGIMIPGTAFPKRFFEKRVPQEICENGVLAFCVLRILRNFFTDKPNKVVAWFEGSVLSYLAIVSRRIALSINL